MTNDLVQMLQTIAQHYRGAGIGDPQAEIGERLNVGQATVSKWMNGVNKPDRHSAKIYSLYHEVTGEKVQLPAVTYQADESIKRVIENMRKMSEESRKELLAISEIYASRPN